MPKVNQDLIKVMEVMSYDALERKIKDLIDPPDTNGNRTWRYYIKETFPNFCIVRDSNENKVYRLDYTADSSDNVTVGQWQEGEYVFQVKPNSTATPTPTTDVVVMSEETEEGEVNGLTKLLEAAKPLGGGKFQMTVIKPGWNVRLDGSPGDKYYTKEFIKSLIPLIEGAKAYADHQTDREERERPANSVMKLVGYWSEAKQEPDGGATATFNLSESAAWLKPMLTEAEKLKNEKGIVFVGPSINGFGSVRVGEAEGRRGKIAESCKLLQSIDIVTEPGAGGTVDKMLEAAKTNKEDNNMPIDWSKITMDDLKKNRSDLMDAMKKAMEDEAKKASKEKTKEVAEEFRTEFEAIKESVSAVDAENRRLREELATERSKAAAKGKIGELLRESKLPDVSQRRLATVLETRDFSKDGSLDETALKEAVDAAITDERAYLTKLTESGRVVGMGGADAPNPAEQVKTVQSKFDGLFGIAEEKKN